MQGSLLWVLVLVFPQEGNEAEKAFRASAKKLTEAETAQISVDGALKGGAKAGKFKGTVWLAKGNKSRLELTSDVGGQTLKFVSVSDGSKRKTDISQGDKEGKSSVQDTPANANALLSGLISRAGLNAGFFLIVRVGGPKQPAAAPELDDLVTASDFALGKMEKIGERQAQRIDYKLTLSAGTKKETIDAQVWLDSDTQLPVKRILSGKKGDTTIQFTESYDIRINGKIEASKFKL